MPRFKLLFPFLALGLPAFLALVAYLSSLGNGFVWDDPYYLERFPPYHEARLLLLNSLSGFAIHPSAYWRPAALFTLLSQAVLSHEAWAFHLFSLLIQCLACLIGGFCIRDWLSLSFIGKPESSLAQSFSRPGLFAGAVFLSGALFALHPSAGEAALWVSGRFDLLGSFFLICAFWISLRFEWPDLPREALGAFLCFLAFLSKEVYVFMAPLFLMASLFVLLDHPGSKMRFWPLARARALFLCAALILYFLGRWHFIGLSPNTSFAAERLSPAVSALSQMEVFSQAFLGQAQALFFPWPLRPIDLIDPELARWPWGLLGAWLAAGAFIWGAWRLGRGCAALAIALFLSLALLSFFSSQRLFFGEILFAKRSLHALAFFAPLLLCPMLVALAGWGSRFFPLGTKFHDRALLGIGAAALFLLSLFAQSVSLQNYYWSSDERLWEQARLFYPRSEFAVMNLIEARLPKAKELLDNRAMLEAARAHPERMSKRFAADSEMFFIVNETFLALNNQQPLAKALDLLETYAEKRKWQIEIAPLGLWIHALLYAPERSERLLDLCEAAERQINAPGFLPGKKTLLGEPSFAKNIQIDCAKARSGKLPPPLSH